MIYVDIYLKIFGCIVWTPPVLKGGGEVNFGTSPGGGSMKDQKRGWKYGAGVGLKKGAGTFLI